MIVFDDYHKKYLYEYSGSCQSYIYIYILYLHQTFVHWYSFSLFLGFGTIGGGTAKANEDYLVVSPLSASLTTRTVVHFPINILIMPIEINIINEYPVLYETPDETILLTLLTCAGASIDSNAADLSGVFHE